MDIETIVQQASEYLPQIDLEIIRRSYQWAAMAHEGQTRESSEGHVHHLLSVAIETHRSKKICVDR